MKFREHRGALTESLKTIVDIEPTHAALAAYVRKKVGEQLAFDATTLERLINADTVKSKYYCYDERIHWITYIVTVNIDGVDDVVGFHDGPLQD